MASFLRKVQNTAKVRSIRKKIKAADQKKKQLSREYKAALKSESKRLGKKKTKKRKTTRRSR